MKKFPATLLCSCVFLLTGAFGKEDIKEKSEVRSLAGEVPGGAMAFFETQGLADLVAHIHSSELFMSLLESEDFEKLKANGFFKDVAFARRMIEFTLRMSIWEVSERLLGGRFGLAAYPAGEGKEPDLLLLIKPSRPSDWLRNRMRFAPLIRLGLKRINRLEFAKQAHVYRTRWDKDEATFFGINEDWIVVTTDKELLEETIALQFHNDEAGDQPKTLASETAFKGMNARMGEDHLARAFLDTRRLIEVTGDNLGIPEEISDPVLGLFLGGVVELVGHGEFAGFTLDYSEKKLHFRAGIDAGPEDVSEEYRLFFSGGDGVGVGLPPRVPGYIGGASLYRSFGEWYRKREDAVRVALIPGVESFDGNVGDLLMGHADGGEGLLGNNVMFLSAHADDAGVDGNGIQLPGFAFVVDLANPDDADMALARLFRAALVDLEKNNDLPGNAWLDGTETRQGTRITYASRQVGEGEVQMIPASARYKNWFIVSSSRQLCRGIIDELSSGGVTVLKDEDLALDLRFDELSRFFAANQRQYEAELVRSGRSEEQARVDYQNIEKFLKGMKFLRCTSSASSGKFEFSLQGEFK
ncbi:MAG: hypothetical protein MK183_04930 [Verrucomicrobiales bacterium]|nr:hypothetical protein [Verrucomicrobiales bacterium]